MPVRFADAPPQPTRLFVNPPEETRGRLESVHGDDEGRFLGYVNEAQRVVRIVPEELPVAAYVTEAAPMMDLSFRTEEAIQLRLTLPTFPVAGMYLQTGGPMVIEGTATMAQNTLYTLTNSGRADVIWTHWTTGTANTTAVTSNVWQNWQTTGTSSGTNFVIPTFPRYDPVPLTAEQIAEQEERSARYARKAHRDNRRHRLAELRAQRLLHELLTDEQAAEYAERRSFHVRVRDRTFRMNHGMAGNVTEVDEDGKAIAKYCVHLYGGEPTEDSMVAQLLMLQTDVEEFERRANVTRYRARVAA